MKASYTALFLLVSAPFASSAVLTSGHVDVLGFGWDDGDQTIVPHAHVDVGSVVDGVEVTVKTKFDPSEIVFFVPTTAQRSRPSGSQWNTIGGTSGGPVWILPQNQDPSMPWPGLTTEDGELREQPWTGVTPFTVRLTNVVKPPNADFAMFTVGPFGDPTYYFATSDGIGSADQVSVPLNTHAHYNWSFTQPGNYEMTFDFVANHQTLGTLTETATYSFQVIPEPSAALLAVAGSLLVLLRRNR